MLYYSLLKVAESFKVVKARIQADRPGLGRLVRPGHGRRPLTDPAAAFGPALSGDGGRARRVARGALPEESAFHGRVTATPVVEEPPPIFLLGSSPDSAALAAHFGLPLAFADFITMADGPSITHAYRRQYDTDGRNAEPTCSSRQRDLCRDRRRSAGARRTGQALASAGPQCPIPTPEETAAHGGPLDIPAQRKPMIVGSPAMKAGVEEMVRAYGADEFMAVTIVWSHEARVRANLGRLRPVRLIVLALASPGAVACTDDREPSAPRQPPTTFEGQPESLTTVPDSGSNDAVPTTTLRPAVPTGITAAGFVREPCSSNRRHRSTRTCSPRRRGGVFAHRRRANVRPQRLRQPSPALRHRREFDRG